MEIDKIYNMDCIEGMKQIPDHSVDCIICDLPYGTTRNAWDSIIPLDMLWAQYNRVAKPNAAICLFAQTPFDKVLGASNLSMLKYEWIWRKEHGTGVLNAKKMPMKNHENVLVFYRKLPTYNPQFTKGDPYHSSGGKNGSNYDHTHKVISVNDGFRYPLSVLDFTRDKSESFHPTQKPVDLIRYFVLTYSNEGDTILDNCMGSGTTAIACIREKRHFIGFELNEEYFTKACERIKNEQQQLTLF